jgi:hypothetical protein
MIIDFIMKPFKESYWRRIWGPLLRVTYNQTEYRIEISSYKEYLRIMFDKNHFKINPNFREIILLIKSPEVSIDYWGTRLIQGFRL